MINFPPDFFYHSEFFVLLLIQKHALISSPAVYGIKKQRLYEILKKKENGGRDKNLENHFKLEILDFRFCKGKSLILNFKRMFKYIL